MTFGNDDKRRPMKDGEFLRLARLAFFDDDRSTKQAVVEHFNVSERAASRWLTNENTPPRDVQKEVITKAKYGVTDVNEFIRPYWDSLG